MSLTREETLALAATMQAVGEMLGSYPATIDLNMVRDDLSLRRDMLLREAGLSTDDDG